jgi:L-rhamnose mutarotase
MSDLGAETAGYARRPVRYGWMAEVKPEKVDYYRELHANPWPAVLRRIKDSNLQNYTIYLQEIDGRFFLFSYFEYVGDNFEEDMRRMEADPETQRWWQETGPCQMPLANGKPRRNGSAWSDLQEVFHLD